MGRTAKDLVTLDPGCGALAFKRDMGRDVKREVEPDEPARRDDA